MLNAETKINQLEYDLFLELRRDLQQYISQIQKTSRAIASLDVLASFAEVSEKYGYVKPQVDDGDVIRIEKGRHPVIEQTIRDGIFVSNDTYLNKDDQSLLLITGPNMSGKSTYMRQTALIVLMAQAGCFVPCERARIGVCDRIFTRIGASDNLAQGQSTFFVEMSELSYILNTATSRSLVILDEIGRGTSTYDGLSITLGGGRIPVRQRSENQDVIRDALPRNDGAGRNAGRCEKPSTWTWQKKNGNVVFYIKSSRAAPAAATASMWPNWREHRRNCWSGLRSGSRI